MTRRLYRLRVRLAQAAALVSGTARGWLCDQGVRTCWDCTTSDRTFTAARGGATREEWRRMLAEQEEQADVLSALAAVPLRPDAEKVLAGLGETGAASVRHATAVYTVLDEVVQAHRGAS